MSRYDRMLAMSGEEIEEARLFRRYGRCHGEPGCDYPADEEDGYCSHCRPVVCNDHGTEHLQDEPCPDCEREALEVAAEREADAHRDETGPGRREANPRPKETA